MDTRRAPFQSHRGYALLLAMLLVVLGATATLVGQLEYASRGYERGEDVARTLAQAREALLGHAATYRDSHGDEVFGYLPCPNLDGAGEAAATCGQTGQAAVGLLPYKTLGLPDLRDADGNCLWYAVAGTFKNNPKDGGHPLDWDAQGQFAIADGAGTTLAVPDQGDGGAAAVIFAAGPPLARQARSVAAGTPCGATPSAVADYLDGGYSFATTATITLSHGIVRNAAGEVTANDRLAWLTPREIFDRVVRRADFANGLTAVPPGQINKLADEIRGKWDKTIQDDLLASAAPVASLPANTAAYSQFPGKLVGDLKDLTPLNAADYDNYFRNWSAQFRAIVCSPLNTPCLTLNGTACRGALMFGGRSTSGQPRTTANKTSSTANLDHFFEVGSGREILNSPTNTFTGATAFSKTQPSADVATCIFPGAFVSFAQDMGRFASGVVSPAGGGNPVSAVSTAAKAVTLGSAVSGAARSGCVWYPDALPMGSLLRVYFRYQVATRGRGFTLALADAATNSPARAAPVMCGAPDNSSLGYAGPPPTGQASKGGSAVAVATASWSGGVATLTTVGNHGFATGNNVTVSGVLPGGYNGTFPITVASTTQFRYGLAADPGPQPAGIRPPKLALEFDTQSNAALLDPSGDHVAFDFWGGATDSGPNGSGSDDVTHYAGLAGSGTEPLNPRETGNVTPTATPVANLTATSWASGRVTATTSGPHGYTVGQNVYLADVAATGYQGMVAIAAVPDASRFTYLSAADPGAYTAGASASRTAMVSGIAGGVATTAQDHSFAVGDYVNLSGLTGAVGCDGTFRIAAVPAANRLSLASHTATCGTGYAARTLPITNATWANGTVTMTTGIAHGLADGQIVAVANANPGGYAGHHAVKVIDASRFSYPLDTDPGGDLTIGRVPGLLTVASLNPTYLSASSIPLTTSALPYNSDSSQDGVIHVRLDVARRYDAANHQATLTLKAYVADRFGNYDSATGMYNTCSIADFKNLSRDLSSLCTHGVSLRQEGIVMNDVSGPAMANVYLGFTNARGNAAGDNQNVVISNLLARSQ